MGLFKKNSISESFENLLKEERKSLIKGSIPLISRANTLFNINDDRFILIAQDLIKNNPYLYFRQSGDKLFKSHLIVQIVNSVACDYSIEDQYLAAHHLFIHHIEKYGGIPDKLIHFPKEISENLIQELMDYGANQGYDTNGDNPPIKILYEDEFLDELARFWAGIWYGKTTGETISMYFGMVIHILSLLFYSTQEVAELFKNYLLEEKDGESKLNSYAQLIFDYEAELDRNYIYKLTSE